MTPPALPVKKGSPKLRSSGNAFDYYVPLNLGVKPNPPVPTGGAKTVKAYKFIKAHFKKVRRSPFGPKSVLPARKVVRDIEVIRAALECGYGKRVDWTAMLVLSRLDAQDLTNYLIARLQMLLACIRVDGQNARALRTFYKKMESSEKAAISFLAGSIGAFLTARIWLKGAGERMDAFLHVGIYTKAVVGGSNHVGYFSTASKWPDYLARTVSGQWHVFESKGGAKRSRWQRLAEGLLQLQGTPHIGWAGQPPVAVTSVVCVHTSVDAGQPMQVTVVDPPPDQGQPMHLPPLELLASVATLMKYLETLQQFRALTDTVVDVALDGPGFWVQRDSRQFPGVKVGVPRRFFELEDDTRDRLGMFIAARDALEPSGSPSSRRQTDAAFGKAMDTLLGVDARRLRDSPQRIAIDGLLPLRQNRKEFLVKTSQMLELDRLAEGVHGLLVEASITTLDDDGKDIRTTGGLRLMAAPPKDDVDSAAQVVERPRA
ncbi:hypothetical protein [Variovorax sp. 770b2]|uniref:hypothetical protein n=1 Tax=Variovorax sp. 770b2 TaxID=1566271 RepID=UPI0008E3511A|nr:hypothetical protein [Variovorax sp. 770b2]SFQ41103.1 hypothetical protein SAMN03159339_0386 [Variovorax sp. 770b2]